MLFSRFQNGRSIDENRQRAAHKALAQAAEISCTQAELLHAAARLHNMFFIGKFALSPKLRESKDSDGNTALMIAAKEGHMDLVRYLIGIGANIFAKNKKNKMADEIALENRHPDIAFLISSAMIDQGAQGSTDASHSGRTSTETTSQSSDDDRVMTIPIELSGSPSRH